jgi:hypothetical protein
MRGVALYGDHSHLYIHGPISAVTWFNGFSRNWVYQPYKTTVDKAGIS